MITWRALLAELYAVRELAASWARKAHFSSLPKMT